MSSFADLKENKEREVKLDVCKLLPSPLFSICTQSTIDPLAPCVIVNYFQRRQVCCLLVVVTRGRLHRTAGQVVGRGRSQVGGGVKSGEGSSRGRGQKIVFGRSKKNRSRPD